MEILSSGVGATTAEAKILEERRRARLAKIDSGSIK